MSEIHATNGKIKDLVLSRMKFNAEFNINTCDVVRFGNRIEASVRRQTDEALVLLSKSVYGTRKLTSVSTTVKIPLTWKDHLKKRMGLKYKTEDLEVTIPVDVRAMFPTIAGSKETITYVANKR